MRLIASRMMMALLPMLYMPVVAGADDATPLRLSPAQAVINAAEMPAGVGGVFEMVVRSTGRKGRYLFLNSESDYRDPRNLTIVVSPAVEAALTSRIGGPLEEFILQKVIAVRGIAKKTRIDFLVGDHPTGKYYFQTQLELASARDLTVGGERPIP